VKFASARASGRKGVHFHTRLELRGNMWASLGLEDALVRTGGRGRRGERPND